MIPKTNIAFFIFIGTIILGVAVLALYVALKGVPNRIGLVVSSPAPAKQGVSITKIEPSSGPVGTSITLTGSGFTATQNSIHFGQGFLYLNDIDSDGKKLQFTLPELFDTCNPDGTTCLELTARVIPGNTYDVTVINANGTSNAVKFTVTR